MMIAGRVNVNGEIIREPGTKAIWGVDRIFLDGKEIPEPLNRLYLMLNKPFGYICSLKDPAGRPIVTDLLPGIGRRVYPVGRLDFDSIGLLLLSDDGDWANRITHPRYHVPKTYKVTVEGMVSESDLETLKKGLLLEDGFSGPSKTTLIRQGGKTSIIRMTITRGKKRLVRRMVEETGHRVIQLMRTGFGMLELGNLKMGDYRFLEPEEIESMKKMSGPG